MRSAYKWYSKLLFTGMLAWDLPTANSLEGVSTQRVQMLSTGSIREARGLFQALTFRK